MKNKKPLPIIEQVEVIDAGTEGQSIAKVNDLVIFIKDAVPGDIVDVQITRKKNSYREGRAIKFHKYSDKRIVAICEHFGVCGGCKWQNMNYETQLFYKQKQVKDSLTRIGKIENLSVDTILPSAQTLHYRNKLEFTFSNKMWLTAEEIKSNATYEHRNALGFHIPKMFDKILDIKECHLQKDPSNEIRLEIKKYAIENDLTFFDLREQKGFLRNLIIRTSTTNELMILVSFYHEDKDARELLLNHLAQKFPQITSLLYVINSKGNDTISDLTIQHFKGNEFIYEQMEGLKFKIGPKSFYQTNSEQAYELYKTARNFADLQGNEIVYDLYTGTGTIALFVANKAKKVVGIEYIASAIDDAKENAKTNKNDSYHQHTKYDDQVDRYYSTYDIGTLLHNNESYLDLGLRYTIKKIPEEIIQCLLIR